MGDSFAFSRVPSLVEHIVEPLKRGLVDVNNYVRRSATMGCAKLFQLAPHVVKGAYSISFSVDLTATHRTA